MQADFDPRYRYSVNLRGSLQLAGRTPIDARVRNLSAAGAMIEHQYRLLPGNRCVLYLELGDRTLPLDARVVWSKPSTGRSDPPGGVVVTCRSGVCFGPLPEQTEICLQGVLAELVPSPLASRRA